MSRIMLRLVSVLLIALAANVTTMLSLSAQPSPRVTGIHERIVATSVDDPLRASAVRMAEGTRLGPTYPEALSGQVQTKVPYYSALTPLLIACGALLALVSLRNSDLANRSRAAVDALEKAHDPRRVESLKRQIIWFNCRYVLCSISFIFLALAGGLFALSSMWMSQDVSGSDLQTMTAWGIGLLIGGLGLLCVEFLLGPITVLSNSRSVRK
jgi:uncharacterized protein DUF2721